MLCHDRQDFRKSFRKSMIGCTPNPSAQNRHSPLHPLSQSRRDRPSPRPAAERRWPIAARPAKTKMLGGRIGWPTVAGTNGRKWCCWGGLNSRPQPYQGCALPLSYSSTPFPAFARKARGAPGQARPLAAGRHLVKQGLRKRSAFVTSAGMTDHAPHASAAAKAERQARLAEQLRANLHRRKAQARAIDAAAPTKTDLPKP